MSPNLFHLEADSSLDPSLVDAVLTQQPSNWLIQIVSNYISNNFQFHHNKTKSFKLKKINFWFCQLDWSWILRRIAKKKNQLEEPKIPMALNWMVAGVGTIFFQILYKFSLLSLCGKSNLCRIS